MTKPVSDQNYFKVNRIMDTNKIEFLEGFSEIEGRLVRKMFLQLKVDILSGNNSRLVTDVKKKIKKDLEKQLEVFNRFYDRFRRTKTYKSKQEAKMKQIIFKECLQKSFRHYSFLTLILFHPFLIFYMSFLLRMIIISNKKL